MKSTSVANPRFVLLFAIIAIAAALGVFAAPSVPVSSQGTYEIFLSPFPDRSGAVLLQGAIVTGDAAVFVNPDPEIRRVRFFLDGSFQQREKKAPWDYSGTAKDGTAKMWDSTQEADGSHTISANITLKDGSTEVVSATFTVANSGPGLVFNPDPLSFMVEVDGSDSALVDLDTNDATVAGYTLSGGDSWLSLDSLSGTTPNTHTISVDATGLAAGNYTATLTADATGYVPATLTVTLNVVNTFAPDQVHLAWVNDPSTTLTIVWRTLDTAVPSSVEYRPLGDATWQSATGAPRPSGTQGTLHEVALTSLTPSTTYEYRVLGAGSTWSQIFTTRTAPPSGPADFDAIYVADTGIEGRLDGLTTGTQQVIDEIANLNPLLLLLGGDYAYFNTDDRFGTLDNTIDAWFNQMQPISTQSPMMPSYGNHEILLGEGFAPWADRFPTPEGFDNRKNYSFDVGNVHFVSILAASGSADLSASTVQWLQQDITDAINAGKTWVIPYFHVSPFADGKNHASNLALRAQLGPLFESLGVKIVLSSHDQAYERTYPLTDVPATNTPTSSSLICYTMADGVTWVKSSPGGKLSNKNNNFSQFATDPPPAWTAYRDNTMHHFTRLMVSAAGSIQVDTYGVAGDGTPPVILDSFQYTTGSCPPELAFSSDTLSFAVQEGGSDSAPVDLDTSDGTVASYTLSGSPSWLSVDTLSGTTPNTHTISVDATGLAAGTYTATITADATGYVPDTLTVTLDVGGGYGLLWSTSPDRSNPASLQGAIVSGSVAVFLNPEDGIDKVNFLLDGSLNQTEKNPPWDFNGTSGANAKLYDTTQDADGIHTITAEITLSAGGTQVVSATFTVANSGPGLAFSPGTLPFTVDEGGSDSALVDLDTNDATVASYTLSGGSPPWLSVDTLLGTTPNTHTISVDATGLAAGTYTATLTADATGYVPATLTVTLNVGGGYSLLWSTSPDRSNPASLQNAIISGSVAVFLIPEGGIDKVNFLLDGSLNQTEKNAPWDFNGTSGANANLYDSTQDADGIHTITAEITLSAGGTQVVSATFTVANSGPGLVFSPGALPFTVDEGSSDSALVDLDTNDATVASYTLNGGSPPWLSVDTLLGTTPNTHTISVDATGLAAGTYTATLTANATGYAPATLTVTLNVGGGYGLMWSTSPDRSNPASLQNAIISGSVAVFLIPEGGIDQVKYLLDGSVNQIEGNAPWDFNGTSGGNANLYDTGQLLDGPHIITAEITLSAGGTQSASAIFIVDNGCALVPCSEILVSLPYELDYDHMHDHGAIPDGNGVGTGFTYIDPPTNGAGYIPANLFVDLGGGTFQITTTAGLARESSNSQDNALSVGIDAPSQISIMSATLLNPPAGTGNDEQAGLWFGNDEDNFVKLAIISAPAGTIIEYYFEVNGSVVDSTATGVLDLTAAAVSLSLRADPTDRTIGGSYSIDGGPSQDLGTFTAPGEFFSFDAAGINLLIGTNSFAGILASHGNGPSPLVYTFGQFSVAAQTLPTASLGDFSFKTASYPMTRPTSLAWGPDDRLYVTEMFGTIHALTYDAEKQVVDDEVIATLTDDLGPRLTLGITVDPLSTPSNIILWVSHSSPSLNNGVPNSGMVSRISGPSFTTIEHIITGLARALANHATNSIGFGPDGRLYIAQGGNTGAGAPPSNPSTEFGDMEEQPLSAAILVADVRDPAFDGSCNNPDDIFGPPPCDVDPYATGLRNSYDFVFHSNGSMYAPDNGLGVSSTYPPSPTPPCFGIGDVNLHKPPPQPDELYRIEQGKYYGHPNPYRDECVFKDGSLQGVPPLPNWEQPILKLGLSKSANGTIEYTSDAFCGALQGVLMIANYSVGDDITVIRLSADGLAVTDSFTLIGGFKNPLPLALGPDGTIYVGEHGGELVTALEPIDIGCWSAKQPVPQAILDAGGTALDGKLYMVAGKTNSGHQSSMFIYDPATDTWTSGPDLPGLAVENPAVVGLNGKLYVFGGSTAPFSGALTNTAVYDPVANSWAVLTPMNAARGGATAQTIGGKIYVVGGLDASGTSLDSVEVYDPATDTWTSAASMSTRRDNPGSAVLNGKLYIFGGRTRGGNATLNSVEMYDPATDTWTARAPMPTGRRTMVVGTLNGRAQVMGGERTSSGDTFEENEEYDPITDSWRALAPMPTPRHGAAAGTINGVVYVAGGGPSGGSSFTDVVEAFSFAEP